VLKVCVAAIFRANLELLAFVRRWFGVDERSILLRFLSLSELWRPRRASRSGRKLHLFLIRALLSDNYFYLPPRRVCCHEISAPDLNLSLFGVCPSILSLLPRFVEFSCKAPHQAMDLMVRRLSFFLFQNLSFLGSANTFQNHGTGQYALISPTFSL